MSTLATYGLFSDWYYDVPPSGERVYWAIPMGLSIYVGAPVLHSHLGQGGSVGNERAVYHEKVTGYINADPFVVESRKYASSFHWTQRYKIGYYNGRPVYSTYTFDLQLYENGLIAVAHDVIDEGTEYRFRTRTQRTESYWTFNGGSSATSQDATYTSLDGGPEYLSARGTSRRTLSGYWTGKVEMPTYNWPAFIAGLLSEHPCEVNFSNLITEAASQMQYSANNIDTVRQVDDIAKSLVQLLTGHASKKVIKRVLRGTSNPRAFGRELKELSQSVWLTDRYAVSTTENDIEDFLDKVGSIDIPVTPGSHIVRAGDAKGNWTCHVKLRLRDKKQNSLAETHRWMMEHGFGITPANLWDLIPFSFMVDWFIPIGDTLKLVDAEFYFHSAYYEILSYTASRKFTIDVSDRGNQFHITVYQREVSNRVPVISNLTYEEPSTRTIRNRVIDTSAIFF